MEFSASPAATTAASGAGRAETCRGLTEAKVQLGRDAAAGDAGFKKGLARLGGQVGKLAGSTSDPVLGTALQDFAKATTALAATPDPATADSSGFEKAASKVESLCKNAR